MLLHKIASRRHCLYFVCTQNIIVIMPKRGSKQSTIQKNKSSKKKGFRGVQKQTVLKAKTRDQTETVAVTFVGEEDVVSERIPPPKTPASSRKLGVQEQESSDSESYEFEEEVKGYRFVSMDSLLKFVRRIHSRGPCASGVLYNIFNFL